MGLTEMIRQAGIVGCGGAGFPTHAKYNGGPVQTIIINGAECEPLLQNDCYLMRNQADALIAAADALKKENHAQDFVIALKHSYKREIASLKKAIEKVSSSVRIHEMDSFFPAGDEQTIVYEVTGKIVPPAGIPMNVGCVVSNVATLYCIYEAMQGKTFTEKYLTVTGEVKNPIIAKVPIGTPVKVCLELAGGTHLSDYIVVNGGPMMGKIMTKADAEEAYVTKTMSGLIVLPVDHAIARNSRMKQSHMLNRAKSACIQCTFCTQFCPRALLGHPIQPHRVMRKLSSGMDIQELLEDPDIRNAALCCECGICETFACPMGLQPRKMNVMVKRELAKASIRYKAEEKEWTALPERILRKAPTMKVATKVGVGKYEDIQIDELKELKADKVRTVRLALRQGIGTPAQPVVKDGDIVKVGQEIAVCPDGALGSILHASIDGKVKVTEAYIEIDSGKGA